MRFIKQSEIMMNDRLKHNDSLSTRIITGKGVPAPLGAALHHDGVNFAIYSKHADSMKLCLFDYPSQTPFTEITLDPKTNKTGHVWHLMVHNLPNNTCYAYRIGTSKDNIFNKSFNPDTLILDPYAKIVATTQKWGASNGNYKPLGIPFIKEQFDWKNDKSPGYAMKDLVIYELHVRGFTRHSSSGVHHPGTFLGMIEKIPYLLDLGVNAVELLPIHEFNECEFSRFNPFNGERLYNYWGYSPVNFFAPMNRYASSEGYGQVVNEFKTLVRELHKNGIEVILDLVFNHTAEGDEKGPTHSFKAIDCETYYILDEKHHYKNFTGCGNTFNCNHPIGSDLIRSCLQYWVAEMHVDGFRFDLTTILCRGRQGEPLDNPPLIEALSKDPILASTKLIAEPWDPGGLYKLGGFYPTENRWSEWNDRYRDTLRKFIKGDPGEKRQFSTRLCGSEDIFNRNVRSPSASINFIISHDGFCLRDLVSYNAKNNSANAENDRDGNPNNISWNCGEEGETDNEAVLSLRLNQMKNFHLALMLSQGTPMIGMGDEYGHTRYGNNNGWCQDNELNWFLWDKIGPNQGFYRFYKELIHFRKRHSVFSFDKFNEEYMEWHGTSPLNPDWDGETQFIAFTLKAPEGAYQLYAAFNMNQGEIKLTLPPVPEGASWKKIVDTSAPSPEDFFDEGSAPIIESEELTLAAHTAILLKETTYL